MTLNSLELVIFFFKTINFFFNYRESIVGHGEMGHTTND